MGREGLTPAANGLRRKNEERGESAVCLLTAALQALVETTKQSSRDRKGPPLRMLELATKYKLRWVSGCSIFCRKAVGWRSGLVG